MAEARERLYIFERKRDGGPRVGVQLAPGQHSWAEGLREAMVLARRLEMPDPLIREVFGEAADHAVFEVRNLLVQMGADFSANIAYYEQQVRMVQKKLLLSQAAAIGVVLALLVALVALVAPWQPVVRTLSVEQSSYWVAQISLVGTAAFAALKAMAVGTNYKARLTAFWQAAADLREDLCTFEANWQDKLSTREALLSPDLRVALYEELRAARMIVRRERGAYIDALASPNDIFSSASDVLGSLDARIATVMQTRQSAVAGAEALSVTTARDVADTRRKLLEAKSKLSAAELALPEAEKAGIADLDRYKTAIVDARSEVELYNQQLRLKLKSDRLNPT